MVGEKFLIKMWTTLTKNGLGALLSPWQIKREGNAHIEIRRNELLTLAQTERDILDIKNGKKTFTSEMKLIGSQNCQNNMEITLKNLFDEYKKREVLDNIQQEINITKSIIYAEENANDDNVDDEDVNSDWLRRWREYAQNISEDDLQHLWANILAGEIRTQGNISLRTLDFIKNLSKEEAGKISKIAPFVVFDVIFNDITLSQAGISLNLLLEIQDIGLINSVTAFGFQIYYSSSKSNCFEKAFVFRNKVIIAKNIDPKKEIALECYKVTNIGKEVFSLGDFLPNFDYINNIAKRIKGMGFEVMIADYEPLNKIEGRYYNAKPV
jgi:Protein of unknown function (DUF2806).